ncbi:unnamed protein product [Adineta ricciae]|uniref:Uncharacterized protein n=1 Tax=Adineta ricciae TaxID=249248 RepID=A0A814Q0Y9_ADIRI|nr:unnamed protein product [Adineta ricciae]
MNPYTIEPLKADANAISTPASAPVYSSAAVQYPRLETAPTTTPVSVGITAQMPPMYQHPQSDPTTASAPMMAPMYMPPGYHYPGSGQTAAPAPAPMVAPVYMPSAQHYQQPRNPPVANTQVDASKIRDWLPWSIISIFLGGFIPGILPLIFSLVCRSKKRKNDFQGAKTMSTLALVFNIIMTILGILSIIFIVIYLIVFSRMKKDEYIFLSN